MIFNRNVEIKEIIDFLLGNKTSSTNSAIEINLMHIYGPEGCGKTDIANFAGQYALKGRIDFDVAILIDSQHDSELLDFLTMVWFRLSNIDHFSSLKREKTLL